MFKRVSNGVAGLFPPPVPALLFVYKEMVFNHATFSSIFSGSCVIQYPFLISLPLLLCYGCSL
jgi:hypothetical protein